MISLQRYLFVQLTMAYIIFGDVDFDAVPAKIRIISSCFFFFKEARSMHDYFKHYGTEPGRGGGMGGSVLGWEGVALD